MYYEYTDCPHCNYRSFTTCKKCNGKKVIEETPGHKVVCDICEGEGEVVCRVCGGSGQIRYDGPEMMM